MVRLGLLIAWFMVTMGAAAGADPKGAPVSASTSCGPSEKLFQCHRRAVQLHLGLGARVDVPTAKAIYASACERDYTASCSNLSVLIAANNTAPTNAAEMFDRACKRLDLAACDNARRLKTGAEFAVKLSFPLGVFDDVAAELAGAACSAGDVFQCSDEPTKNRVAALLARECRGGEIGQCIAAALASSEADYVGLMTIACDQRVGKACYGLAKRQSATDKNPKAQDRRWKTACLDAEFDLGPGDQMARNEACLQVVAKKPVQRSLLLSVATASEQRCERGEAPACLTARAAFDRAGSAARAFAVAERLCGIASDCRELSDRYALGRGTVRSIRKALELDSTCDSSRSWEVCRAIAAHLTRESPADAAKILEDHCQAEQHEACYLAARRIESAKTWCTESVSNLHGRYSNLCALNIKDSCAREKQMCQLAQSELRKSRRFCHGGVGDGSFQPPVEYEDVRELCPPVRWNSDTKRTMRSLEQEKKDAETRPFPRQQ